MLYITLSHSLSHLFSVSLTHTHTHTECTLRGLSAPVHQCCRISPVNDWTQCVAAIHIHLFSINVIYVFFMLPLGLEQFSVRDLCANGPLTPAVSNYSWGMEPRLSLQPPVIIWVMAKWLNKPFPIKIKIKGGGWRRRGHVLGRHLETELERTTGEFTERNAKVDVALKCWLSTPLRVFLIYSCLAPTVSKYWLSCKKKNSGTFLKGLKRCEMKWIRPRRIHVEISAPHGSVLFRFRNDL